MAHMSVILLYIWKHCTTLGAVKFNVQFDVFTFAIHSSAGLEGRGFESFHSHLPLLIHLSEKGGYLKIGMFLILSSELQAYVQFQNTLIS